MDDVGDPLLAPLLPHDLRLPRVVHGLGRRAVDGAEERRDERVALGLRPPPRRRGRPGW